MPLELFWRADVDAEIKSGAPWDFAPNPPGWMRQVQIMVAVYECDRELGSCFIVSVSMGFWKCGHELWLEQKAACLFVCFSEYESE